MADSETLSLRLFLGVLRRRRWAIVLTALVATFAAGLLALREPADYRASAVLLIGAPKIAALAGLETGGQLAAGTAARLARTRAVAERVRRALKSPLSTDELLGRVSTSADPSDGFLTVTARGDTGPEAAQLANAFADQFVAARAATPYVELGKAVSAIERQLGVATGAERSVLQAQLTQLQTLAGLPSADVEVVDPAVIPGRPVGPRPVRNAIAGLFLGLLLGVALALALEALDPRVKTVAELRRIVRGPQLAGVPASVFRRPSALRRRRRREPRVLAVSRRHPEAFERLRTSLLVFNGERDLKIIVVTSAHDEKEGKTTVAANLAVSLAKVGLRVCVVDADLRSPRLARHFGVAEGSPGLSEVLAGARLENVLAYFPVPDAPTFMSGYGNGSKPHPSADIAVLPAGGKISNPSEALASKAMQDVLDELERDHDVVVVDCAPLLAYGDGMPLLARACGTLLVVRLFHTRREAAARAAQVIQGTRGGMLGGVGTGMTPRELREEGYGPWPVGEPETSGVV